MQKQNLWLKRNGSRQMVRRLAAVLAWKSAIKTGFSATRAKIA
jgi:hypothetical protein